MKDESGAVVLEGTTKDERFDSNDHLLKYLKQGAHYTVDVEVSDRRWSDAFQVGDQPRLISWDVPSEQAQPKPMPESGDSNAAIQDLEKYLAMDPDTRGAIDQQAFATLPLSKEQAIVAERLLIDEHQKRQRESRIKEFESRQLELGELKMPFAYKVFGDKPEGGRSLYISMHGGGGAPKQVNDSQWENQKRLYKLEEGVYVAPRAPTDTWDLWHQSHIDAFFDRLIQDFVLFEDVNPDRVYLMGYSAGGDGVYQVAPRMADRFAAASMMAGHPNETSPLGLRNLPFTIHMGGNDGAYNRNKIAAEWKTKLAELREADPDGYDHFVKIHEGKGHWMDRQDAEAIQWMHQNTRNRFPKKIVWKQDDVVEPRFYWLSTEPTLVRDRPLVVAKAVGNEVVIEQAELTQLNILLKDDFLDMNSPVTIRVGDREIVKASVPRTIAVMDETLNQRGDPHGIFWGKLSIEIPDMKK